jgi:hypothetical protein
VGQAAKGPANPRANPWAGAVAFTWLKSLLVLGVICAVYVATRRGFTISDNFLMRQDLPVALSSLALMALIALPVCRFGPRTVAAVERFVERRALALCLLAAVLVAGGAFAGWWLVCQAYPLSMDEFWVTFDARIFSHGRLIAPVLPQWRPFTPALQPMWRLVIPGGQGWASTYLPMNAAFRALFGLLGSQALAGPFWAGLSIVLTYALARDFWPARRDAAFVAAILLATSSQLIVTAMTPYAMSAHLALNLGWLWLFRRKGVLAGVAAMVVAFAATGLHQFIFHPLFAAPFVLELWLQRRWRPAALYTLAYAGVCLFWVCWWPILFASQGLPGAAVDAATHGATAQALAMAFNPVGPSMMAENLLRFMLWQNPLAVPLAMLGALAAWRGRDGAMLSLAGGLVLTLLFLLAITPFQGHGWGYRYVHGFLGGLCLLAAFAWIKLTERSDEPGRAWAALAVAILAGACLWLPIRLHQAHDFIAPYARSWAAIERAPADVVIVDTTGLWYADDLVRNDPFLERGPKIMHRYLLTDDQIRGLCARYRVGYFGPDEGRAFGITRTVQTSLRSKAEATVGIPRYALAPPPCGRPVTAHDR